MTDEKAKRRRGCLFYGCLGASFFFAIMLIGALVGLRYAKKMFTDFTDSKPMPLPQVQLSPTELDALQRRIETFRTSVKQGQPAGPLTLSADEINALIATDPDVKAFREKIYVTLEGDQLKSQVSLPMQELGLPVFKDRYLNGTGTFDLVFSSGMLRLSPRSFVVKGKPLPEIYLEKARKQNLAASLNEDARGKAALEQLQEIKIKDGQLIIIPK
jgi:hypothetical protein